MIRGIYQLGEWQRERRGEKPFWAKSLNEAIPLIILELKEDGSWHPSLYEVKPVKDRLLYRSSSSQKNPPISPIFKYNIKSPKREALKDQFRKFSTKVLNWIKSFLKYLEDNGKEEPAIAPHLSSFSFSDELRDFFLNQARGIYYVTFSIDGKFLWEYPTVLDYIKDEVARTSFYQFNNKECTGEGVCFICGSKKLVSGNVKVLGIYTLDKPGFIAGGMQVPTSWRNFPICWDCMKLIELGEDFLENNLGFSLGGGKSKLPFILIPEFRGYTSEKMVHEVLDYISENLSTWRRVVLLSMENDLKTWGRVEASIRKVAPMSLLTYLFYVEQNKRKIVLALIEEVKLSWIVDMIRRNHLMQEHDLVYAWLIDRVKRAFSLETLYNIAIISQEGLHNQEEFLSLISPLLRGLPVPEEVYYRLALSGLRPYLAKSSTKDEVRGQLQWMLKLTAMNYWFIASNNSYLRRGGESIMGESLDLAPDMSVREKVNRFFSNYPDMFNSEVKKAAFLLGVLTQMLAYVQQKITSSGGSPILRKLRELKMKPEDMMSLYRDLSWKFKEYSTMEGKSEPRLLSVAAEYLLRAGDPSSWNLRLDELNFFFALGMALWNLKVNGIKVFSTKFEEVEDDDSSQQA